VLGVQANIKPGLVSKAAAISASRFKKRDPIRFERISTPSLNWCGRASYAVLGQSQEFAGSRQPTAVFPQQFFQTDMFQVR
jgi:hypothetical protein